MQSGCCRLPPTWATRQHDHASASTTHGRLAPEVRQRAGISESLVRIAVGLEDVEDLQQTWSAVCRHNPGQSSAPVGVLAYQRDSQAIAPGIPTG